MRLLTSLLLALLLALLLGVAGFGATTTTIDLSAITPTAVNTVPSSFNTTAATDTVTVVIAAGTSHTLMFQDTQDWSYVDPTTNKTIAVAGASGQTISLTFNTTQSFKVTRSTVDGVCTVMVLR